MVRHTEAADKIKIQEIVKDNFEITGDFEIADDGSVTVYGDCTLITQMSSLPVKFKEVVGIFDCSGKNLASLEGAPQIAKNGFYIYNNNLTSLKGVPQRIFANFDCSSNSLTSLEGAPLAVNGSFDCRNNNLTSLIGAPQFVGRIFDCSENDLTSIEGLPNAFSSILIGWKESLPLLRLVGRRVLFKPKLPQLEKIINKFANRATRANILTCQKELIDAGFEENASW